MPPERTLRRTTDVPAQQAPRTGVDLSLLAERHAVALRIGYLACILLATLLRLGFDATPQEVLRRLERALVPPLNAKDIVDGARNIALFFGWGATWVLTAPAPTARRDIVRATLFGLLASLSIETLQLFSLSRQASLVDVWTNTVGSLLGAVAMWMVEHRSTSAMRRGTMIGVPGWLPAGALLLTALGLTFAPSSRATIALAWAPSPFERARVIGAAAALDVSWAALLPDVFAWLAVGLSVAVAIGDGSGRLRRVQLLAWLVIAPGMLATAHIGRAMVGLQREGQSLTVQAAALVVGLAIGLVAMPRWRAFVTARSRRALQLALLAAVLGALMSWAPAAWAVPPTGARPLSWTQLVPMYSLWQRQDMSSVFLVLQRAGIGAALGACLAARRRVGRPMPGLWAAVGYAAVLELGQLVIPGRYPDVTDVLITGSAAALVLALVERADRGVRAMQPAWDMALNGRASSGSF
ncbi:MAG TPA: VanZ family protein [Gemmatimonadaceae bacterium]|nr:VanZ family protein [Gemmatimonadaceae bacterium]